MDTKYRLRRKSLLSGLQLNFVRNLSLYFQSVRPPVLLMLEFSEALNDTVELFLFGKRISQFVIDSILTIPKTVFSMGNLSLAEVAQIFDTPRAKFGKVCSADNFGLLHSRHHTAANAETQNRAKSTVMVLCYLSNLISF